MVSYSSSDALVEGEESLATALSFLHGSGARVADPALAYVRLATGTSSSPLRAPQHQPLYRLINLEHILIGRVQLSSL